MRIIRTRIGTLKLGDLKPRQWRYLTEDEVRELKGGAAATFERKPRPKRFRGGLDDVEMYFKLTGQSLLASFFSTRKARSGRIYAKIILVLKDK